MKIKNIENSLNLFNLNYSQSMSTKISPLIPFSTTVTDYTVGNFTFIIYEVFQ